MTASDLCEAIADHFPNFTTQDIFLFGQCVTALGTREGISDDLPKLRARFDEVISKIMIDTDANAAAVIEFQAVIAERNKNDLTRENVDRLYRILHHFWNLHMRIYPGFKGRPDR